MLTLWLRGVCCMLFNAVLFAADTAKVEETKQQMRREDMWRERWARIDVPDRALNIGTLR